MRPVAFVLAIAVLGAGTLSGATVTVEVRDFFFDPADVTIEEGDTITWVWVQGHHTSTSDDGLWNSGYRFAGDPAFSHTFATAGTYRYYCQPHGGPGGVGMSGIIRVTEAAEPPAVPAGFTARATTSSAVVVNWQASDGATSYEVYRSTHVLGPYSVALATAETTATDLSLAAGTTYLYKVRALGDGGESDFSPVDAATTIVFADGALFGVIVKAVHLTEVQTAVNAMRTAAGLEAGSFSAIAAGALVEAAHVEQLRTALDEARAAIGLAELTYTDGTLTSGTTLIKAAHAEQLRAGTQ